MIDEREDVTKKETGEKGVLRVDGDDADQILDAPIILDVEDDPEQMLDIIKKRLLKRQKGGKKQTISIEVVPSFRSNPK